MCGFAGLVSASLVHDLSRKLGAMSDALRHRGPDDVGYLSWTEDAPLAPGREAGALQPGRVGLMHRRLSIFDLSPLGWQPMLDPTGRRALVFNGEIYNHPEIRADLEREGQRFKSTSDTEVLLALLARDGLKGLSRLVGMYAFACLDLDTRRLLLVRDAFGIKPLHYVSTPGRLAFASEIKALLASGEARAEADPAALFRYLRHGVTNFGGSTVFAGVRELEPGTAMEIALDGGLAITRHDLRRAGSRPARRTASRAEAAAHLCDILERNVALHMRADVPVAAALSGGVDSSGIVALMRRKLGPDRPLHVFTYVAADERLSEKRFADVVAAAAGATMTEVRLDPERLGDEIDDLIRCQEQPFTTTSVWAQSHVYKAAHAAGFKIVIDGQGADEALAGYHVFRAARIEGLIRRGRLREARALVAALPSQRGNVLIQAAGGLLPESARGYFRRAVGKPVIPEWLNGAWFGAAAVEHRPVMEAAHSPLATALRDAVGGSSLPMLLRYADRNAMAVSVENRVPFLTAELVDFAMSLPDELLIGNDGTMKQVLRDALRGIVPDVILDRRDKIGFETPEALWFRTTEGARRLARDTARLPLPPCFAPSIRTEIAALAEARVPFAPHHWRAMNVIRWTALLGVSFDGVTRQDSAA